MTLPDMGDILFLRLITQIYSTSDFQHAVITPALLLMGQYLCMCPVTSETDALVGLSISQILFKCHEQSKRLQPEVVSYLLRIVTLLSNNGNGDGGCGGEHVHQDDSWFDVKEVEASAVNGPIDGLIASLFMKSEPETKR